MKSVPAKRGMSTCAEIKSRLTLYDVAAMARVELPQRPGVKFRSPFRPDRHPSCSVYRRGESWRFKDWSLGIDVDQIGFYSLARGIDNTQAIRELAERIDCRNPRVTPKTSAIEAGTPVGNIGRMPGPMPSDVAQSWNEGVAYLAGNVPFQQRIAAWRRWTAEAVAQLAEDGMMGTPMFRGERLVAFRVDFPVMKDFGPFGTWFSTVQVGWHVRRRPKAREKAQWRFMPNQGEHRHSAPALPFVLGDFQSARLLVITEGQFDCITFAHVAGWLSHDAAWPDWVCVLGLRGANGINPFLFHYTPLWPKDAKCWLLPDNDAAGRTWFEADNGKSSFAERLSVLCREVHVETIAGAKDFNQAWQLNLVAQADIGRQLQINGFTDAGGHIR
jgi:hypothetical protein